jgi:hypothetical protein
MNRLIEIKKRLMWRWLALIEKNLPDDHYPPTDADLKQRLETMTLGETIRFVFLMRAIELLKLITGDKDNEKT